MKEITLEPTVTERRRATRNKIYRYILHSPQPASKQQLVNDLQLSLPTIHQNVQELLEAGLIKVGEVKKSTGGRPPIGYTVEENARYAIGVAITANHLRLLLSNLKREQLAYKSIRIQQNDQIDENTFQEVNKFIEENEIAKDRILGVGITVPGIFDSESDSIVISPSLNVKNFSLQKMMDACPYPIYIANDSTAGGIAEQMGRREDGKDMNFVYLLLENGIGGAIILNNQLYEGINDRSGEFGHMCVEPGGRLCNCGKKGCLEAYVGAFRFTRDLGISQDAFFLGLQNGNEEYEKLWDDVLQHLSVGIANLRMAFDCDIVLGGFVSDYLGPYMDRLRALVAEHDPFMDNADYLQIGKYSKAAMMGASWHFISDFVDSI